MYWSLCRNVTNSLKKMQTSVLTVTWSLVTRLPMKMQVISSHASFIEIFLVPPSNTPRQVQFSSATLIYQYYSRPEICGTRLQTHRRATGESQHFGSQLWVIYNRQLPTSSDNISNFKTPTGSYHNHIRPFCVKVGAIYSKLCAANLSKSCLCESFKYFPPKISGRLQ